MTANVPQNMIDTSEKPDKMNASIDICKLLMAVLVVGIHTRIFGFSHALQGGYFFLTRLCVPFFFMASAYFFYLKQHSLLKYIKRIGLLYLAWFFIFLPCNIKSYTVMGMPKFLSQIFFVGAGQGTWYLVASIWGIVILEVLLKFFKPKVVFAISCACFIFGCFSITWSNSVFYEALRGGVFPNPIGHYNAPYRALAFMAAGMLLAKSKNKGKQMNLKTMIIGFIVSLMFMTVEYVIEVFFLKSHDTHMNLFHLPAMFFFFCIWNNIDIQLDKEKSLLFRKMSILLYLSHRLFLGLMKPYFDNFILFIVVLAEALLFSYSVVRLSGYKHLKCLKWLY